MSLRLLVALVALAASAAALTGNWTIVDNDYATIAMGCSFQTSTSGWVAGSTASLQPLLLHTTNGGGNFTNAPLDEKSAAFLSISMFDATHGVAGGLGFFGLPCGAVTSNGSWSVIHDGREIVCAFQSAQAVSASTFILTGSWATPGDFAGNGVQISTDAGKSWSFVNWNQGTDARYAYFFSSTTGYISGGSFPSTLTKSKLDNIPLQMTENIAFDGLSMKLSRSARASPIDGYAGVIAKTTNGGKSFTTVYNITGQGLYFNEIFCIDINTCWAAAEGIDPKTFAPIAYLYATTDGWNTVQTQLTFPSGSLVTVNFLNSTFGWVGGAILPSSFDRVSTNDVAPDAPEAQFEGVAFLTTDGGKTWTQYNQLRNFYFFQISTVSASSAYCAGLTSVGLSSLARFQA